MTPFFLQCHCCIGHDGIVCVMGHDDIILKNTMTFNNKTVLNNSLFFLS